MTLKVLEINIDDSLLKLFKCKRSSNIPISGTILGAKAVCL